jgi:hypothetical protein
VVALDDVIKKKAGRHIEGLDCYRNSAGSARQAYHPLRGVHFVLGVMRLPLTRWPGHCVTLPIGWARYRKAPWAKQRRRGYGSRSPLGQGHR